VKNQQKTIGIEKKLNVIMQGEKGDQIIDICHNVTLANGIVHNIHDIADRITGVQSGTKVFV
jgi:hypothetical protein